MATANFDLLVHSGLVVAEDAGGRPRLIAADLATRDGRIAAIAARITTGAARTLDARGLIVLPGLIDPHVHVSLPMRGTRSRDDATAATRAALFGGVTTLIDFTLQEPLCLQAFDCPRDSHFVHAGLLNNFTCR